MGVGSPLIASGGRFADRVVNKGCLLTGNDNLHVEMIGVLFAAMVERGLLTTDIAASLVNAVLAEHVSDGEAHAAYRRLAHDLLIYPGEMEDQER